VSEARRFTVEKVLGAHQHADGSLTLVAQTEEGEVSLECDGSAVMTLLGLCLQNASGTMEHDGLRIGQLEGHPTLSLRFGEGRWLNVLLEQRDLAVLQGLFVQQEPPRPRGH
jgi:hypothetical protein